MQDLLPNGFLLSSDPAPSNCRSWSLLGTRETCPTKQTKQLAKCEANVKQMWSKCSRMINHSYATQFECLQSESPCSQEIWTNVTAFVTRISKSEFQRLVVLRSEGSVFFHFFPFSCYVASTAFAASACGVHLLEVPKGSKRYVAWNCEEWYRQCMSVFSLFNTFGQVKSVVAEYSSD